MKDFLQGVFGGLVVLGIVFGILYIIAQGINAGIDKDEIRECKKWQEYSAQYQGFYIVQWQKDQCDAHQITINAPVK